jgi:hypothetical protein
VSLYKTFSYQDGILNPAFNVTGIVGLKKYTKICKYVTVSNTEIMTTSVSVEVNVKTLPILL